MLQRCSNCLIPSSRPEQVFKKNICDACLSFEKRKKIDWKKRETEFNELLDFFKKRNNSSWDCIVPSSGGKDSLYQSIFLREKGLRVLVVTATTCDLSDIGRYNIENMKKIGFDMLEVSPNKKIRAKLNKFCLETVGDISWPEHISIFTLPVKIAYSLSIPLIFWGENPQFEYGGPLRKKGFELDRDWLEEFGGLLGLRIDDAANILRINKKDLDFYFFPEDQNFQKFEHQGCFLGYFFEWDNIKNYEFVRKYGFKDFGKPVENCYLSYEKLDNYQHGIHDYFKYLKYGFGRATDQLSLLIRRNKISRSEAIKIVSNFEGKYPSSYLGKNLKEILNDIEMTIDDFDKICKKFTNKEIFKCNQLGELDFNDDKSPVLIDE